MTAACAGLVAGLVGGAAVVGIWQLARGDDSAGAAAQECDVEHIADTVLPSVVTLHVRGEQGQGTGSGVVVQAPLPGADAPSPTPGDGAFIVTNEHVVGPAGTHGKVAVTFSDGSTSPGRVVGADATTDLAAVVVDGLASHAPPVGVGKSRDLRVGRRVVALGAPLGLSSTVTAGIVSATDRYVRVPSASGAAHHLVGAIQTDASINPGNSGGALVDCSGDLVGINSAGASPPGDNGSVGLNFAIPSSLFGPLATELFASGRVQHPTLGMQVAAIPPEAAQRSGTSPGLLVQAVDPGGPARRAGVQPGDVVVEVDGKPVRVPDDLTQLELGLDIGTAVDVVVERSGQSHTVSLTPVPAG